MRYKLSDAISFNPKESLKKGTVAKKIAMDKLQPFYRDIPGYEMAEYSGGAKFRNGDTIMARITPCLENGKTAQVNLLDDNEIGFGSTEFIVFRAKPGITDPDYIYYLVCSPVIRDVAIKSMVGSSGRQRVQTDVLQNLEYDFPDFEEQKKIGSILRALDDKISLNQKINDNLEQQARTLFKVWFQNDSSTNNSSERPLSELCEMITKGTTPTTLGRSFTERGINFIKAESISDSHVLDPSRFAHIDDETHALLKRSIIRDKDIVFTIAGTLGRFALIDESILPANTNQAVAIIRTNRDIVSPYYLYSFFIANWHNEYYAKHVQQAVQANLSLTTIKSLPIPVLSDDAMKEYLAQITPIFELIKNNEQESRNLSNLRDTLLPKLMSGEIDVEGIEL